jgi:phospholipid/cholesterol/gamma-HCH transport system substrate-binding protein
MNDRRMQFRVGVAVFFTMIATAVLMTVNEPIPSGWLPFGQSTYRVGIEVPNAPGIGENSPVRKNGVLIGRVESVEDKDDRVVIYTAIDSGRELTSGHVPHVRTTMLGDATIEFMKNRSAPQGQPLTDEAVVIGVVDENPLESLAKLGDLKNEFADASASLARAGDEVAKLAERVNEAFGGDEQDQGRVGRLLDTTEDAMQQFSRTMSAMNEIIGDPPQEVARPIEQMQFRQPVPEIEPLPNARPLPNNPQQPAAQPQIGQPPLGQEPIDGPRMRQRLRQGLNEMPEAIREARITMQQFRETLELANTNLRNLEGFTEPLGQKGEEIAATLIRAIDGLDTLVRDFTQLTNALNNREGTIGRLIHDAQAYENLNRLMCNANIVLGQINDLTLRLKPVVNDARVFMDKIAREPGRIVTGGINPSITK